MNNVNFNSNSVNLNEPKKVKSSQSKDDFSKLLNNDKKKTDNDFSTHVNKFIRKDNAFKNRDTHLINDDKKSLNNMKNDEKKSEVIDKEDKVSKLDNKCNNQQDKLKNNVEDRNKAVEDTQNSKVEEGKKDESVSLKDDIDVVDIKEALNVDDEKANEILNLLNMLMQGNITPEQLLKGDSKAEENINNIQLLLGRLQENKGVEEPLVKNLQSNLNELVAMLKETNKSESLSLEISKLLEKISKEATGVEDRTVIQIKNSLESNNSIENKSLNAVESKNFIENKNIEENELPKNVFNNDMKIKPLIDGNTNLEKVTNVQTPSNEENTITQSSVNVSNIENSNSKEGNNENKSNLDSSNSDEDFLKSLTSENKGNDKILKATNFMTQFNKIQETNSVEVQAQKLSVNRQTFGEDIIKSVKFMELNNMKDLTVKVVPRELGEVVIKLTMEAGVMKAQITANNKEAYSILNSNIQNIQDKLQTLDISIQNLDINIYQDTTFFNKDSEKQGNSERNGKGNNHNMIIDEEEVEDANYSNENSTVNMFV